MGDIGGEKHNTLVSKALEKYTRLTVAYDKLGIKTDETRMSTEQYGEALRKMEYGEVLRSIKQMEQEQANLNARMMEGKASIKRLKHIDLLLGLHRHIEMYLSNLENRKS